MSAAVSELALRWMQFTGLVPFHIASQTGVTTSAWMTAYSVGLSAVAAAISIWSTHMLVVQFSEEDDGYAANVMIENITMELQVIR